MQDDQNIMAMMMDLVAKGKVTMILRPTGDLIIMAPDALDKHYSKFQSRLNVENTDTPDDIDLGV